MSRWRDATACGTLANHGFLMLDGGLRRKLVDRNALTELAISDLFER